MMYERSALKVCRNIWNESVGQKVFRKRVRHCLGFSESPRVALTWILAGIIRSSRGSARSPTSSVGDLLQTFENRQ